MSLEIYAENFRSFPLIDWKLPSGLTLIDGINKDTGGSNMAGKCFGKGTPVLMYDGTIKPVEEIVTGDLVMGIDSSPRKVLGTNHGNELLYKVIPNRGEPYIVNKSHILTLKWCSTTSSLRIKNDTFNIAVKDYLNLPNSQKDLLMGYRASVDFKSSFNLKINPYFLGIWLGDGHSESVSVTTMDPEIVACIQDSADQRNLRVLIHGKSGNKAKTYTITSNERMNNSLFSDLVDYGMIGNKHIPYQYKISSRNDRLSILAGLLDTDGCLCKKGGRSSFEYVSSNETLAKDVSFVAQSLGFGVSLVKRRKYCTYKHKKRFGDYWIVLIWGDIKNIPTRIARKKTDGLSSKKNPLYTGISIGPIGDGEYFGFQVNGDGLFLLGDFTVVHNSTLLDAWFWCRYGWLPKWKGPKGGSVDAVLRRKNNVVVGSTMVRITEKFGPDTLSIERHRPNRLRVFRNGIERPGMDQKALEAVIGSPERFLVCVYLPQRRQRSFYWMGDNDRTELISIVAGLEDVERAAIEAKELRDEAKDTIEQFETKIGVLEGQMKHLPARIKDLTMRRDEADRLLKISNEESHKADLALEEYTFNAEIKAKEEVAAKIDPMIDQLADIKFSIQSLEGSYDFQKKHLENFPLLDPKYRNAIIDCESEIAVANNLLNQIAYFENEIYNESDHAVKAQEGKCSQCNQLLPDADSRVREHRAVVEDLKKKKGQIKEPDLSALKSRLSELKCSYEQAKSENDKGPSELRASLAEMQSHISEKRNEERIIQRNIQSIKDEAARSWKEKQAELKRALDLSNREVKHHKTALKSAQDMLDLIQFDEVKIRKEIIDADQEIRAWKIQLDEALDLVEIFGPKGYRAICFDGLIEKLSDRAGQLLSIMTQGLYSTRLDQLGQDSKGNQKIILKPVIIKGGSEVPSDDLSGGAEERVALAYDVAIAEAAGEGLPLLLDEVLSGLDAVGKTEAMALLEEVSKTRPVLVIDHASEFKAMFSQVVRVIYENEESRLEVA